MGSQGKQVLSEAPARLIRDFTAARILRMRARKAREIVLSHDAGTSIQLVGSDNGGLLDDAIRLDHLRRRVCHVPSSMGPYCRRTHEWASGWRDLNSRPLDPQIGPLWVSSVNHLSLVSIVDRWGALTSAVVVRNWSVVFASLP